jgi:transcription-repair coupling factor (superfamily II helicase)
VNLSQLFATSESARQFLDAVGRDRELRIHAPRTVHPLIAGAVAGTSEPIVVVITANSRQAEDVVRTLASWAPHLRTAYLPSWETLPHERLSPSLDTMGRRIAVFDRLRHGDGTDPLRQPIDVLVTSVRAFTQPVVASLVDAPSFRLRVGDDIEHLDEELVMAGYERVDLVERRGQIASRGAIVDVFPPTWDHPVRIELWGDTIESIRLFSVADQRSLNDCPDGVLLTSVREVLLTEDVRTNAARIAEDQPAMREVCSAIAAGIVAPGMESLAPLLGLTTTSIGSLLASDSRILVSQPELVAARSIDIASTAEEFMQAAWQVGERAPLLGMAFLALDDMRSEVLQRGGAWWEMSALQRDIDDDVTLPVQALDSYRQEPTRALTDVSRWCAESRVVLFLTAGHGSAERIAESFQDADIPTRVAEAAEISPGVVQVMTGFIEQGFTMPGLAVITESDLTRQRSSTKDMQRMPTRRRRTIDPLTLQVGDFVVHEQHGVGRYVEMMQRTVAGSEREYLVLEYAASKRGQPADRLFVPMDQLDLITRYVGGESPSVHRLGGSDWQKSKGRARKAVKEIAAELVRLYAARQATSGHAYGPDTPWQHELEDAFAYVETPDQLACIDEVKADMEKPIPMDRLICGDVGYGKTEIAVRAAFKAVQDGKQVAILVPTTLLVQQHLGTFGERFAAFPIRIAGLSRFTPDREVRETLEGITAGTVDVVIGTHRLLTPQVKFKDLGLVIVDEEQRFGVEHKEHLKALRTNVDVLAMSATPIPRSLEMAVTGIREMSVIQTPPEERHPVLTFVGPYDEKQITAAIHRELLRDGQVFFVHNRVSSIDRVATKLRDLVPEARIAVAHGQMGEHALEQIILDFWEGEIDVLVCTTIVESGIDIPNANTLIVDRADTFGLSQLHQLRGRVGRGRERAYAYFMYNADQSMTQTAHERLTTIAQHNELGSGMHIAMKDLEIRGAGNLLGGEQSGHIADVGFDLYVRLVGEALAEVKGSVPNTAEVRVELPIDAHIPHDYVPHERLRLEAYRRIAEATTEVDIEELQAEFQDRYGPLPQPVHHLLAVARLRAVARDKDLREIVLQGRSIRISPVTLAESAQMRLTRLYPGTTVKPAVRTILVPQPMVAIGQPLRDKELIDWVSNVISVL